MNENKTKIIVLDETGNEKEAEILSAFSIKKYNKNYILYTLNEVDENDMIKIYASELIEKSLPVYQDKTDRRTQSDPLH